MHPQRAARDRGQREGLDGWSHNELGLETTLGPDDPISGRQSDEDELKILERQAKLRPILNPF